MLLNSVRKKNWNIISAFNFQLRILRTIWRTSNFKGLWNFTWTPQLFAESGSRFSTALKRMRKVWPISTGKKGNLRKFQFYTLSLFSDIFLKSWGKFFNSLSSHWWNDARIVTFLLSLFFFFPLTMKNNKVRKLF